MTTYNFKQFKNVKGEEMLMILTPGKMCKTTEDCINTPSPEKAKQLFTIYIDEISEMSKEEFIEDYKKLAKCRN